MYTAVGIVQQAIRYQRRGCPLICKKQTTFIGFHCAETRKTKFPASRRFRRGRSRHNAPAPLLSSDKSSHILLDFFRRISFFGFSPLFSSSYRDLVCRPKVTKTKHKQQLEIKFTFSKEYLRVLKRMAKTCNLASGLRKAAKFTITVHSSLSNNQIYDN